MKLVLTLVLRHVGVDFSVELINLQRSSMLSLILFVCSVFSSLMFF